MQIKSVIRILGLLLMLFSLAIIPPILVSIIYQDNETWPFFYAFILIFVSGLLLWLPAMQAKTDLKLRDGFIIVVLFWFVLSSFGSLPLLLSSSLNISITNAIFESISGLTTTGATILINIDDLPKSILFYRQYLQWLGGLGIIVLAVAVLPMLGVGGMQLYKAEVAGPIKNKLTPRITETAKWLWIVYLLMTFLCAISYYFAGMNIFDSICHSFSTIAIGGFSTHAASFGYYDNQWIELIAIFFMIAACLNFSLHYLAFKNKTISPYRNDNEAYFFLFLMGLISFLCISYIYSNSAEMNTREIIKSGFYAISIATTTGFTNTNYVNFVGFLPILLILFSFIGGCAGSTAGGMKVIRVMLLLKQGYRELRRLIHPNSKIKIKVGNTAINERTLETIWGFFAIYVFVFLTVMLLLMLSGLDFITSFSAVAATINNLGPGQGEVLLNYASISDINKWILSFSMIVGRLEIFTLLVIFTPDFWKK
ncbi:MAG: potassium transporter [Gammaproteobacteria bacterium]|jgi:trk system potassium uptake protein|nr:potassium transporter [Gammaproteobacteria bacterium]MBT7603733.1 potassium transporter [Gammaproteobacteria bacterium]